MVRKSPNGETSRWRTGKVAKRPETPANEGAECRKYEKNRDSQPIPRFISELTHDIAIRNAKPYSSFRMLPFWMTLSDLEWLIDIFNDTKYRAVSLRQLSFLSIIKELAVKTQSMVNIDTKMYTALRTASCGKSERRQQQKMPKVPLAELLSASLYFSKRVAYWDRLCRDVVGRWLSRACTVAKRCILGL